VAESIAAGLRTAEYQVDLYNMIDGRPPDLDGYDLLGLGAPVYYFRMPFTVMDYVSSLNLNALPGLAGFPTFVFLLYGTFRGNAGNLIRHTLADKGAREVGYFCCMGGDYYLGYLEQGYLFSPDHPTTEELAQAESFGRQVAAHAAGEPYDRPGDDPQPILIHRLERSLVNRWLVNQVYSRLFVVDAEQCTACGLCMQVCPTRNIAEDEDRRPVWGRDCEACLFCALKCPQDAITTPASRWFFRPLMAFNVRYAARDPSLDRVRVTHERGRTRRV
jgi:Pyruvate/2-oxoacid:ferredoxin oxidoreductase delta subunit/flavodoxin